MADEALEVMQIVHLRKSEAADPDFLPIIDI